MGRQGGGYRWRRSRSSRICPWFVDVFVCLCAFVAFVGHVSGSS